LTNAAERLLSIVVFVAALLTSSAALDDDIFVFGLWDWFDLKTNHLVVEAVTRVGRCARRTLSE